MVKKILSYFTIITLFLTNFNYIVFAQNINNLKTVTNISDIDILQEGITANNAGLVMSEKMFTDGNLNLDNLKFSVLKGAKIELDKNVKNNFEVTNKTRLNFKNSKLKSNFKAQVNFEDKVIEYPDRVRIITKSKYSYNNKSEYDSIFSGTTSAEVISSKDVSKFLSSNPEYKNKYSTGIPKVNKKDIIEKLTDKLYGQCSKKTILTGNCNKTNLRLKVENELNAYKGTRIVTETIDVNKIPLVYNADKSIDFTQRLKDSNISKEPKDVRLTSLQIKNSFAQYASLNVTNNPPTFSVQEKVSNTKTCEGKGSNCQKELDILNSNNSGTNQSITYSGTLLNGFTLGKSYSYTLSDSYSVLGYTVYDIGVSFYAGYGAGIRIPIEYKSTINKDKLEKGVSENYNVSLEIDTVKKDKDWFVNALGENKAFDGKEAVLEAGAYAKGWIILFEKTVFNEQIGGKKDWGSDQKIPFGNNEKTKIFDGEVAGNEIGLEVILYGVHISGDLKAEGFISGDITYECRSVSSVGVSGDGIYCKDLLNTTLKDNDITDIKIDPNSKTSILNLKGVSEKSYYKNDLGVYQKYGVSLNNFKYKPDLSIDLSLRGKVGVDTGDYFGWFWLKTPWLKVYTFELDLPTLKSHEGYNPKKIEIFDNNYLYNFSKSIQDTNESIDSSTSCINYSISSEKDYFLRDDRFVMPNATSNTFLPSDYPKYYNYNFGGNMFYKTNGELVYQNEFKFGDANGYANYYHILSKGEGNTTSKYGYTRKFSVNDTYYNDFINNNVSEMQFVDGDTIYYYSQAENAIYTGNIKDKIIAYNPVPKIKNDTKYKDLDNTNKPKKNSIKDLLGDEEDYQNITDYHSNYKFKKFSFDFSSDFAKNKMFAYIAENKDTKKVSVRIYKDKTFFKEIDEEELDYNNINPIHIELIGTNLVIISNESSQNEKKYVVYEYKYEQSAGAGQYVMIPEMEKKEAVFNIDEIPTAFSYNKQNKTLFVSYLKPKLAGGVNFTSKIASIRFNGNINTPYKKDIYEASLTKEELISKIDQREGNSYEENDYISDSQVAQSYITNIQLGKNPDSLLISLDHSFAWDWELGSSSSRQHYVYTEARELNFNTSQGQKDNDGNCINNTPPTSPSTMNIGPNINGSGSANNYNSTDSYVNEKLQEIDDCFKESYNSQLKNINDSIDKLIIEKDKQTDEKAKVKYDKAIAKLEEIKKIFILKYRPILELNK